LRRVGARDEARAARSGAVPAVAVAAVAPAVARLVRAAAGRGTRRGRPDGAVLLVAQVPRLAVRIRDRVVGPRREAVLAAVARPRVARARLGGEEAEGLVGDDVDPRRGRQTQPGAVRLQADDVLAAVFAEPAVAVEEAERLGGSGRRRALRGAPPGFTMPRSVGRCHG